MAFVRWQLAGGSRHVAVGRWPLAGGSWQVAVGRWPNCLMAVRKAVIRCPYQLVVGKKREIAGGAGEAGAGVLSTFYVLMAQFYILFPHYIL